MSVSNEVSGVKLEYVLREIKGKLPDNTVKFSDKENANVFTQKNIVNPVIVFFPNKTTQVLSSKRAEALGFFRTPNIMNFSQVEDSSTAAGRFKFAVRDADRKNAWLSLETSIINNCIAKGGHPLPLEVNYSPESFYYGDNEINTTNVELVA